MVTWGVDDETSLVSTPTQLHSIVPRSIAPYISAKIAMNVYPMVSESPEAKPRALAPQRSNVINTVLVHVMPW